MLNMIFSLFYSAILIIFKTVKIDKLSKRMYFKALLPFLATNSRQSKLLLLFGNTKFKKRYVSC